MRVLAFATHDRLTRSFLLKFAAAKLGMAHGHIVHVSAMNSFDVQTAIVTEAIGKAGQSDLLVVYSAKPSLNLEAAIPAELMMKMDFLGTISHLDMALKVIKSPSVPGLEETWKSYLEDYSKRGRASNGK